ncbi:tetratricopeptide repeat protein [Nocardia fluminea]|uniref:tetratricopeptide repeat protein n=1 Tax=Nocardia fluminea TaxID=134984 RepID=UPI001B80D9A6|nr:tetratricopeptide repeat protein [Nocardia fluminea]
MSVGRDQFVQVTQEAPAPPRPRIAFGLPADPRAFLGRDRELRQILDAATVGPGRVVSIRAIDGMPGVGKTTLALHAAHLLADRFPDGRYMVELHAHTPGQPAADPSEVLAGLLIELGIDPRNLPDSLVGRRDLWRDRLADRKVLVILDDAADHAQITPLLPSGAECLTLITSRRRLVALDDAVPLPLDVLDPDTAATLFTNLAHRELTGSDRGAVAEIVRLCGYLPLAIVLLAGRLAHHPTWTVTGLATDFVATRDRLAHLHGGHREVRAAFDMSYHDLPPHHARLLRYLGVYPGPDIDVDAAAALADIPTGTALTALDALYTDHLIEETRPGRYRLHDLVGEYARTLADTDPPEPAGNTVAVDRLLDYYQATATAANRWVARRPTPTTDTPPPEPPGPVRDFDGEVAALSWLRVERANLLACLAHAVTDDPPHTVALTNALSGLLDRDGPWTLAAELYGRALTTARRTTDRLGEATTLTNLGLVRANTADYAEATDLHQRAQALYREIGNRLGEATTLTNLGNVRERTGDYAEANDLYQRAQALFWELGNRLGEASTLTNLGNVRMYTGDYGQATDLYQRAQALYREIGNRLGEATTLNNLGLMRENTGDYAQATDLYQRAQALYREIGNRLGEATTLNSLGNVRERTGNYAQATDLHQQALTLHRELGHRLGEASTLTNLGNVREKTGDYAQATDLQQQALTLHREIGNRFGEAAALTSLGLVRERTGDYAQATDLQQQALTLHRELGDRFGEAAALTNLGLVREKTGDYAQATDLHQQALTLFRELGNRLGEASTLTNLGNVRMYTGDYAQATDLQQQALILFREIGHRFGEAEVLNAIGTMLLETDQPGQALDRFTGAAEAARAINSQHEQARALEGTARCRVALGAPDTAVVELREAVEIYRRLAVPEAAAAAAYLATLDDPNPPPQQ